ncbi:MAG: DUF2799 domain-containing protein [Brevundimonas sp.]|uniref:DUF2799 domain-containing protein n=1 Tax=Brevundimonas sp. TaxID=1871086 RepID=UPI00272580C9|nr:DUF2799 domain-containing protein [Brevundimonas sp.]MDO9077358.1 DUF2799 domain-containing protein [Brevundimonas sp.]MDZ4059701.1 DUF2799 domain-containing protein [Brevundimonas sp.]
MRLLLLAAAAGAALAVASCATMSKDQCLAGAWGEVGYRDGLEGQPMSLLADHEKACAEYGVAPDVAAYSSARADGLNGYCRWERGFQEGRQGDTYHGVCTRQQEEEFLPAYQDGQVVYAAEQALTNARSSVASLGSRLEELDDKITAKQAEARAEGLTDEQRDAIRNRIQEIRRERADTERDWRRAQDAIDDAEFDVREVRRRFQRQYGGW